MTKNNQLTLISIVEAPTLPKNSIKAKKVQKKSRCITSQCGRARPESQCRTLKIFLTVHIVFRKLNGPIELTKKKVRSEKNGTDFFLRKFKKVRSKKKLNGRVNTLVMHIHTTHTLSTIQLVKSVF